MKRQPDDGDDDPDEQSFMDDVNKFLRNVFVGCFALIIFLVFCFAMLALFGGIVRGCNP